MKKFNVGFIVLAASLALSACSSSSGTNNNATQKPDLDLDLYLDQVPDPQNPNPVATVNITAPKGFLIMNQVTPNGGTTRIGMYLIFDPMFSDKKLKAKHFIPNGRNVLKDHVVADTLMTVSAYNNENRVILSEIVGVMADSNGTYSADLNAVGTAITSGVVGLKDLSVADGIDDDVAKLNLKATMAEASAVALQVDGLSRTDATNATESVKNLALESELAKPAANQDAQELFNANLNGTTWVAGNGSALLFAGNVISYEVSGTADAVPYVVEFNNGNFSLTADFNTIGTQALNLNNLMAGVGEVDLMGQTYTRQ